MSEILDEDFDKYFRLKPENGKEIKTTDQHLAGAEYDTRQPRFATEADVIIISIIIISAHKSDLSNPWSQTQASPSIPSLHPKTQIKEEREENITDEKASPDLIGGGGGNKTRAKNKSTDPPRISERQINKQARQTKCQDHTTVDTVRESLSTPHQSLGGGSGQSSVETKEHQYSKAKNHPLLFCGIQIDIMGAQTVK